MGKASTISVQPILHPVRVVAQRTGLTPDLLRAREKRYGAVRPVRSVGGQRHYTDEIGAHAYGDVIREIGADPLNSVTALRRWLRRRIAVPMV